MTVFPCATLSVCVCCERLAECVCFMCASPFRHRGLAHYEVIRDAKLEVDRSAGATHTHTHGADSVCLLFPLKISLFIVLSYENVSLFLLMI